MDLAEWIDRMNGRRIAVLGDMIADVYLSGKIARISREAPVLVLEHQGERVVAGGMITGLNQRYTKAGQPMATFSLEDLTGTVEVIVFPKCFAEYGAKLREDARVLIRGRATVETDADARLIAEEIRLFSEVPRRIWIQFPDRASYDQGKEDLRDLFAGAHAERPGSDTCTVYLRAEKQKAPLDDNLTVKADRDLLAELKGRFGEENVKLV